MKKENEWYLCYIKLAEKTHRFEAQWFLVSNFFVIQEKQ